MRPSKEHRYSQYPETAHLPVMVRAYFNLSKMAEKPNLKPEKKIHYLRAQQGLLDYMYPHEQEALRRELMIRQVEEDIRRQRREIWEARNGTQE